VDIEDEREESLGRDLQLSNDEGKRGQLRGHGKPVHSNKNKTRGSDLPLRSVRWV